MNADRKTPKYMSISKPKKVYVVVTTDLATDIRVQKVSNYLHQKGLNVTLVGRKLKNSPPIKKAYKTKRLKHFFNKGFLFYSEYNIRIWFFLLFKKFDFLVANDLDALFGPFIISKIRNKPLVFDSHEYFTEVPEIQNKPFVKKVWKLIEKMIVPGLKHVYTVNQSIADLFIKKYNIEVKVVRNIAPKIKTQNIKTKKQLGLPDDKAILILQGCAINIDRGTEEAIEALQYVNNAVLLIIGEGDVFSQLKNHVEKLQLNEKVIFKPKMSYDALIHFTSNADIGLSLDKDTNINYRYSLPNKLFDYIQSGIAILVSNLVEVAKIVHNYRIGCVINTHDPKSIASTINYMLEDKKRLQNWKHNSKTAAQVLNWENEQKALDSVYNSLI
jgi:glycosyltransferase involved in cell wall biosynthesis